VAGFRGDRRHFNGHRRFNRSFVGIGVGYPYWGYGGYGYPYWDDYYYGDYYYDDYYPAATTVVSVGDDAVARCAARFRSFNPRTGTYVTYGGETKLCPYLR
jgi:hypothetical protein